MTNNKTIRLDYVDIAKGLGMLTIIWGHIHFGVSNTIVYSFHIPLFFFLSGLVFNKSRYENFGVFIKKRLKGLVIPYVVFSIITWLVWVGYVYFTKTPVVSYWMPLLQTILAQGSEGYLVHNVPLWFVMCLFVVEILYYFISGLPKMVNLFICVFLSIVGAWSSVTTTYDFSTLPWSIDVAMMAIPFYAAGNLIIQKFGHRAIQECVCNKRLLTTIVFIVTTGLLYIGATHNGHVSMGHAHLGDNPVIFYPTACCGVVCFMIICLSLANSVLNKTAIMGGVSF